MMIIMNNVKMKVIYNVKIKVVIVILQINKLIKFGIYKIVVI